MSERTPIWRFIGQLPVVCFLLTCRTASLLPFTGKKGIHPFISHERSVGSVSEDWQSGFSWLYRANIGPRRRPTARIAKGRMRIRARQIPVAAEGGNQ
jgi:hypothetical protein